MRLALILLLTSCLLSSPLLTGCDEGGDGDGDGDGDVDVDGDSDSDANGDSDTGVDGDVDSDADGDGSSRCGDDRCEGEEDVFLCPEDCDALCPDGACSHDEDAQSCAGDCPADCGDGLCTHDEDSDSCRRDCPVECVPETCSSLGVSCGTAADGCGETLDCGPPCPLQQCESWDADWSCVDRTPTMCSCSCFAWGTLPGRAPRLECELVAVGEVYCTCMTGGETADRESTSVHFSVDGASCDMARTQFDSDFCGLVP